MFEHHKKESPILSLAGIGGGPASYIFYSASGSGDAYEISRSLRFAADAGGSPYLAKSFHLQALKPLGHNLVGLNS